MIGNTANRYGWMIMILFMIKFYKDFIKCGLPFFCQNAKIPIPNFSVLVHNKLYIENSICLKQKDKAILIHIYNSTIMKYFTLKNLFRPATLRAF